MPPSQRAFWRTAAPRLAGKWPRLATTRALAGLRGNADEHRLQAERADPQAELIILGHAAAGERPAVLHRGKLGERLARDRAADAGQRDRRADRFAHHQLLDVRLGELVAIMAADPARTADRSAAAPAAGSPPARSISPSKMRSSSGGRRPRRRGARPPWPRCRVASLVGDQRVVEVVEAVGLGRRAVGFDLRPARCADRRRWRSPPRSPDRCGNGRRRSGNCHSRGA